MKPRSAAQRARPLGTRVRLNEEGMKRVSVLKNRLGLIAGYSRDGEAVWVQWDGQHATQPWWCWLLVVAEGAP
mgnify:CR=1 FL=1